MLHDCARYRFSAEDLAEAETLVLEEDRSLDHDLAQPPPPPRLLPALKTTLHVLGELKPAVELLLLFGTEGDAASMHGGGGGHGGGGHGAGRGRFSQGSGGGFYGWSDCPWDPTLPFGPYDPLSPDPEAGPYPYRMRF